MLKLSLTASGLLDKSRFDAWSRQKQAAIHIHTWESATLWLRLSATTGGGEEISHRVPSACAWTMPHDRRGHEMTLKRTNDI